eukprot:scaffold20503_cov101-Isochrysis_galbana.AAC.3
MAAEAQPPALPPPQSTRTFWSARISACASGLCAPASGHDQGLARRRNGPDRRETEGNTTFGVGAVGRPGRCEVGHEAACAKAQAAGCMQVAGTGLPRAAKEIITPSTEGYWHSHGGTEHGGRPE